MNTRRVAKLLREQARIATELALEFEDAADDGDELADKGVEGKPPEPSKPRGKPRAKRLRARTVPAPLGPLPPPTDIDMIRARNMLRRRGITT